MTEQDDSLSPVEFPTLADFAAGYLHEDFIVEHGNHESARDAFLREASPDERRRFDDEAERYLRAASRRGWRDVAAAFGRLGGAWRPANRAALARLLRPSHAPQPGARNRRQERP